MNTDERHGGDEQRVNTFDDPGGNAPDAGGDAPETAVDASEAAASAVEDPAGDLNTATTPGPDHHGQDGARDTISGAAAQKQMAGAAVQDVPAMSQNNASDAEKLAGIVAQTRADLPNAGDDEFAALLRKRADQAGVPLDEAEAARLAAER